MPTRNGKLMRLGVLASDYYGLLYPYNLICTILFATITVVSVALLVKYATLRRNAFYAMCLALVGVIEFQFSMSNAFVEGVIISLVTMPLGFAFTSICQLEEQLAKNQVKILLTSTGLILLSSGAIGIFNRIISPIPWLILLTSGSYLLIITAASFFVTKQNPNK